MLVIFNLNVALNTRLELTHTNECELLLRTSVRTFVGSFRRLSSLLARVFSGICNPLKGSRKPKRVRTKLRTDSYHSLVPIFALPSGYHLKVVTFSGY